MYRDRFSYYAYIISHYTRASFSFYPREVRTRWYNILLSRVHILPRARARARLLNTISFRFVDARGRDNYTKVLHGFLLTPQQFPRSSTICRATAPPETGRYTPFFSTFSLTFSPSEKRTGLTLAIDTCYGIVLNQ